MITDYDTLKSQLASFLARPDIAAQLPVMIQLAESDIRTRLENCFDECAAYGWITGGKHPLPSDFKSLRSLVVNGQKYTPAHMVPVEQLRSVTDGFAYSIADHELWVYPTPGEPCEFELLYQADFVSLDDVNKTNWLLEKAPHVYLFGALVNGEGWLFHDERAANWLDRYEKGISDIIKEDNRKRWGWGAHIHRRAG